MKPTVRTEYERLTADLFVVLHRNVSGRANQAELIELMPGWSKPALEGFLHQHPPEVDGWISSSKCALQCYMTGAVIGAIISGGLYVVIGIGTAGCCFRYCCA